jgi:hypothetical protein
LKHFPPRLASGAWVGILLIGLALAARVVANDRDDAERGAFAEYLYDRALEEVLSGATLAEGSPSELVLHERKSFAEEEDLETVAALAFAPLRATLRHPTARSLRYQLAQIVSRTFPLDEREALRRIQITTVTVSEAQCPALREIRAELAAVPLALPLPPPPASGTQEARVFLHPRLFGIEARGAPYDLELWAADPALPAYAFAKRSLEKIRACAARLNPAEN